MLIRIDKEKDGHPIYCCYTYEMEELNEIFITLGLGEITIIDTFLDGNADKCIDFIIRKKDEKILIQFEAIFKECGIEELRYNEYTCQTQKNDSFLVSPKQGKFAETCLAYELRKDGKMYVICNPWRYPESKKHRKFVKKFIKTTLQQFPDCAIYDTDDPSWDFNPKSSITYDAREDYMVKATEDKIKELWKKEK